MIISGEKEFSWPGTIVQKAAAAGRSPYEQVLEDIRSIERRIAHLKATDNPEDFATRQQIEGLENVLDRLIVAKNAYEDFAASIERGEAATPPDVRKMAVKSYGRRMQEKKTANIMKYAIPAAAIAAAAFFLG